MADVESLPPSTLELLRRMSAPIAGPEQPIVIPSLFRYFAHDKQLLQAIWRSIGPAVEDDRFRGAATAVLEQARDLVGRLPFPVPRVDEHGTRQIANRFTTTIPGMIVTTKLLRVALRERLNEAVT